MIRLPSARLNSTNVLFQITIKRTQSSPNNDIDEQPRQLGKDNEFISSTAVLRPQHSWGFLLFSIA
jgi:pantothenate synthetase